MKLGKFILGLGIGAVAGLLLAPKKGSELREDIKNESLKVYENVKNMSKEDIESALGKTIESVKKSVDEFDVEEFKDTALREVLEESGAKATIIKYIGKSEYSFSIPDDTVSKEVHWYLMMADSYYSKPQREEYFLDSGFYKYHEAYHLLKFSNEKQILEKAYNEYIELKRNNMWGNKKYY